VEDIFGGYEKTTEPLRGSEKNNRTSRGVPKFSYYRYGKPDLSLERIVLLGVYYSSTGFWEGMEICT
jgi:hypothetical protein